MYCHRQRRNLPPLTLQVQVFRPYHAAQSNSQFYDLVEQDLRVSVLGAVRALVPLLRSHPRSFMAPLSLILLNIYTSKISSLAVSLLSSI